MQEGDSMARVDLFAIGERIRNQRVALGYTQQYVYEKLDVSHNHYSRIENGHVGMSFEILLQLCEILKVSTDYILIGKLDTSDKSAFLDRYNKLSNRQKQYIDEHIKMFSKYNFK